MARSYQLPPLRGRGWQLNPVPHRPVVPAGYAFLGIIRNRRRRLSSSSAATRNISETVAYRFLVAFNNFQIVHQKVLTGFAVFSIAHPRFIARAKVMEKSDCAV
jgi:hypothetical protein